MSSTHLNSSVSAIIQDEVLTVAARVGLSAEEACGVLLGPPCEDPYDPWHQDWNITVPDNKPPVVPIPDPKVPVDCNSVINTNNLLMSILFSV